MSYASRVAARVLLVDPAGDLLLFEGRDVTDPDAPRWWFTPGGGVEPGESLVEAAVREVAEETGHVLDEVVGPFCRRRTRFRSHGRLTDQVEHFFAARVDGPQVRDQDWTELERAAVTGWRWWSAVELAGSGVAYHPEDLLGLLVTARRLLDAG